MAKEIVKRDETDFMLNDSDMDMMMMMFMMMIMLSIFMGPMAQQLQTQGTAQAQSLQAQSFVGNEDPRDIHATNNLSWINLIYDYPFQPWISAFIINDGPSAVEIGINFPDDRFTVNPGETRTITRSGAEERIRIIYFVCVPGLTANLRVTGVY